MAKQDIPQDVPNKIYPVDNITPDFNADKMLNDYHQDLSRTRANVTVWQLVRELTAMKRFFILNDKFNDALKANQQIIQLLKYDKPSEIDNTNLRLSAQQVHELMDSQINNINSINDIL